MAYKMTCLLDERLQGIYELENGVSYSNDEIVPAFTKILNKYYQEAS